MTYELAYNWLLLNDDLYEQPKPLGDRKDEYFEVYNFLTGQNKRTTSCGRCLSGMRGTMRSLKRQYTNMKEYKVYRTAKGNLTFKTNGGSIFSIHAGTELTAKDALLGLKNYEKRENKKLGE
jgi:hypothetical protein